VIRFGAMDGAKDVSVGVDVVVGGVDSVRPYVGDMVGDNDGVFVEGADEGLVLGIVEGAEELQSSSSSSNSISSFSPQLLITNTSHANAELFVNSA